MIASFYNKVLVKGLHMILTRFDTCKDRDKLEPFEILKDLLRN